MQKVSVTSQLYRRERRRKNKKNRAKMKKILRRRRSSFPIELSSPIRNIALKDIEFSDMTLIVGPQLE